MAENDEARVVGYRLNEDGEVESQTFEGTKLPTGWKDTPAKLKKD